MLVVSKTYTTSQNMHKNTLNRKAVAKLKKIGSHRKEPHKTFGIVRQNCYSLHKIFGAVSQKCDSPNKSFNVFGAL